MKLQCFGVLAFLLAAATAAPTTVSRNEGDKEITSLEFEAQPTEVSRQSTAVSRFDHTWRVLSPAALLALSPSDRNSTANAALVAAAKDEADAYVPTFNRLGGGCGQFVAAVTRRIINGNKGLQAMAHDPVNSQGVFGIFNSAETLQVDPDHQAFLHFVLGDRPDGQWLYVINTAVALPHAGTDHAWVVLRNISGGTSHFLPAMGYVPTASEPGYSAGSKLPWQVYDGQGMSAFLESVFSMGVAGQPFPHSTYNEVFHMLHPEKDGNVTNFEMRANIYGPMAAFPPHSHHDHDPAQASSSESNSGSSSESLPDDDADAANARADAKDPNYVPTSGDSSSSADAEESVFTMLPSEPDSESSSDTPTAPTAPTPLNPTPASPAPTSAPGNKDSESQTTTATVSGSVHLIAAAVGRSNLMVQVLLGLVLLLALSGWVAMCYYRQKAKQERRRRDMINLYDPLV